MPNADRYARYREDQTTIWVSKTAAQYLAKERAETGESTSAALDRMIKELRSLRKGGAAPAAPAKAATKAAAKGGARSAAKKTGGMKRAGKTATKAAAKGGAKAAAKKGAAKKGAAKKGGRTR